MLVKHKLLFIVLTFLPFLSLAQVNTPEQNPYSVFGVGDIQPLQPLRNIGMGGLGLATPAKDYINFQNPSLLSRTRIIKHIVTKGETVATIAKAYGTSEEELRQLNDITLEVQEGAVVRIPVRKYTMWDAAIKGNYRNVINPYDDYDNYSLGFQYFTFSVPISQKVSSAIGIAPYSTVGFETDEAFQQDDTTFKKVTNQFNGGLYQAFISGGFDITQNFSAGLQAGFLFGNIQHEDLSQFRFINEDNFGEKVGTETQTSYSGLILKPGIFYTARFNKASGRDSAIFMNIGATYTKVTNAYAGQTTSFQIRTSNDGLLTDSLVSDQSGYVTLPDEFGFGIAFQRPERWMIGAEITYGNWSKFSTLNQEQQEKDLEDIFLVDRFSYSNSYKVSVGGEVTRIGNRDRVSLKSPTYRAGLSYEKLPYVINGKNIYSYSASLGATLPVGRISAADRQQPLTKINIALVSGFQGDKSLSTGREFFIRAYAGILISDRWFRRRKIQ